MKKPLIAQNREEKIAIITAELKITGGELLSHIQHFANFLSGRSLSKVAIFAENRVEWIYAFYAALQNDAIVVPIDYMASPEDVSYILNDCRPEVIFISTAMTETYKKLVFNEDYRLEVVVFEDHLFVPETPKTVWQGPKDYDKTAVIIYTSGTTGSPKGVMLSFNNIIINMNGVVEPGIFKENSEVLMLLPLHHVFPLVGSLMLPIYAGGTIVICPSMQASDMMKTLADNKVELLLGVPRLYEMIYRGLMNKINQNPLAKFFLKLVYLTRSRKLGKVLFKKVHKGLGGHIQYMIAGGAALNREVGYFFHYLGFDILEGFGMTEAAPMITFPRPGHVKIGSTGQALNGLEIAIREGEIVAKGPNIMQGYYNRPEETAEVLKDGWLYTGDLGYLDKDGFLYITGRKKEIIVLPNGKNINPVELEMKLESFSPAIKEVGIFLYKELLHAVIYPDDSYITKQQIVELLPYFRESVIAPFNASLSSYKRIMQFTLVDKELPRTRLSKLQRFKLEELIHQNSSAKPKHKVPETSEYLAVKTFLESQVDMDITPDSHLVFDIALDSLGKLSLIHFIEKSFGVKISEEQLIHFPSIHTIAEHIRINKLFHKLDEVSWSGNLKTDKQVELPRYTPLMGFTVRLVRLITRIFISLEVKGIENIPEGACFLAPNHQSKLDAFLVLSYLDKKTLKSTYSYAKRDHVKGAIRRFLAHYSNIIVMDLNKELNESISKMAEVVKAGKKLLIFPEGTRTLTGELGPFKKTYAILSTELGIPVVPIVITGAFFGDPDEKSRRKRTHILIEFLPAISPEGLNSEDLNRSVREAIKEKLPA